jgi:hypothetical protein
VLQKLLGTAKNRRTSSAGGAQLPPAVTKIALVDPLSGEGCIQFFPVTMISRKKKSFKASRSLIWRDGQQAQPGSVSGV